MRTEPPSDRRRVNGYNDEMHPAARIFLGLFAIWTLLKLPLFFMVAEQTRRHLGVAPSEISKTLRNRMISSYGTGLLNIIILALTATIAIRGSTSFVEAWGPVLIPAFVVAAGISLFGLKAHFDSLHNPLVDEFYRRYGIQSSRFFRRGRSAQRPTEGG